MLRIVHQQADKINLRTIYGALAGLALLDTRPEMAKIIDFGSKRIAIVPVDHLADIQFARNDRRAKHEKLRLNLLRPTTEASRRSSNANASKRLSPRWASTRAYCGSRRVGLCIEDTLITRHVGGELMSFFERTPQPAAQS